MPKITVNDQTFQAAAGERLVLAIEEHGVNIGHRCGGNAKCTTCRVEFLNGEPAMMTRAEFSKLRERDLLGRVRLSCQIVTEQDMNVRALMTLENQADWADTGPTPEPTVKPEAEWFPIELLERESAARGTVPTFSFSAD